MWKDFVYIFYVVMALVVGGSVIEIGLLASCLFAIPPLALLFHSPVPIYDCN